MAAIPNQVTIGGNATRDPELRFTPSGTALATFGLANNRRFQRNGEWVEEVAFFDITCWGQLAENVSESIVKGNAVIVTGRLSQESWEDKQTGQKRTKVGITADNVAPSLAYATAQVTRNERSDAQGGPSGGGRPPARATAARNYDDEEPF